MALLSFLKKNFTRDGTSAEDDGAVADDEEEEGQRWTDSIVSLPQD